MYCRAWCCTQHEHTPRADGPNERIREAGDAGTVLYTVQYTQLSLGDAGTVLYLLYTIQTLIESDALMQAVGRAINDTFKQSVVSQEGVSAPCGPGIATLVLPAGWEGSGLHSEGSGLHSEGSVQYSESGSLFDYVMTMEDLSKVQWL
jgi:hypothetical protein